MRASGVVTAAAVLLLAGCGGGNAFGEFGGAGLGTGTSGNGGSVSFVFAGDANGDFAAAGSFPAAGADSAGASSWATALGGGSGNVVGVAARQDLGGGLGDQLRLNLTGVAGGYACDAIDVDAGLCPFTASFALAQPWLQTGGARAGYLLRAGTVVVEANTGQRVRGSFRLTMANALTGATLELTGGRFDVPLRPEGLPF